MLQCHAIIKLQSFVSPHRVEDLHSPFCSPLLSSFFLRLRPRWFNLQISDSLMLYTIQKGQVAKFSIFLTSFGLMVFLFLGLEVRCILCMPSFFSRFTVCGCLWPPKGCGGSGGSPTSLWTADPSISRTRSWTLWAPIDRRAPHRFFLSKVLPLFIRFSKYMEFPPIPSPEDQDKMPLGNYLTPPIHNPRGFRNQCGFPAERGGTWGVGFGDKPFAKEIALKGGLQTSTLQTSWGSRNQCGGPAQGGVGGDRSSSFYEGNRLGKGGL